MAVTWNIYDPEVEILESARNLPHRDQTGALTFVTYRLADSMPTEVIVRWRREIADLLIQHNLAGRELADVLNDPEIPNETKRLVQKFRQRQWHNHLDDCHGECVLKRPAVAEEVRKSLLHFNGERLDVERFVIMPNHVHVLIQIRAGFELRKQFREIQRYSARQINTITGRTGRLWQGEPFDHIVRSGKQFLYLQGYIRDNPVKAKLSPGEYLYWQCE